MGGELSRELQELLDKEAIRELVNAYFNASDRHDHDKMRSLYHEDAIDDHGQFFKGLAMEFVDKLPEIQEPMEILHHNMTTFNLKLDGDYAEGEVYVLAFHRIRGEEGSFDLLIGGRYFDKYEKRDGVWKFLHKAVVADWATVADPSAVNLDHPVLEGSYIGEPGPSDPSYEFFKLFKWGQR